MSAPKRKREVQLNFRVSPEELALIEQKMAQLGTTNRWQESPNSRRFLHFGFSLRQHVRPG